MLCTKICTFFAFFMFKSLPSLDLRRFVYPHTFSTNGPPIRLSKFESRNFGFVSRNFEFKVEISSYKVEISRYKSQYFQK